MALTALGIGAIIGAGIFASIGTAISGDTGHLGAGSAIVVSILLAGFTSALVQVGAPPYYVYVLPQRLAKMVFVATTSWYFAAVNLMKVVPYFALGQFSASGLATSVVLMPLAVATNLLGIWLVRRTPTEIFYKLAHIFMFFIALELIRQGGMTMWRG